MFRTEKIKYIILLCIFIILITGCAKEYEFTEFSKKCEDCTVSDECEQKCVEMCQEDGYSESNFWDGGYGHESFYGDPFVVCGCGCKREK